MDKHRAFVEAHRDRYDELLELQGGGCAICGARAKTRRLHIDHDHRTMQLRGLLCYRCNRGLPTWADDNWLDDAYFYVREPPALQLPPRIGTEPRE
jgi:hypothetical protein